MLNFNNQSKAKFSSIEAPLVTSIKLITTNIEALIANVLTIKESKYLSLNGFEREARLIN